MVRMALVVALLAAGVAFSASRPALADPLFDAVAAIPGEVEIAEIGGTWASGNDSGQYRIVVTRSGGDGVTARLFIQWLAYQDGGTSSVRDTIEIKEFADLGVDVVDLSPDSDDDGLSVIINTRDPNGTADATYELFVSSPTKYRFGPASN